jgi:hypothetical protein
MSTRILRRALLIATLGSASLAAAESVSRRLRSRTWRTGSSTPTLMSNKAAGLASPMAWFVVRF